MHDLPPDVNIGQWRGGIAEIVECDCIELPDDGQKQRLKHVVMSDLYKL
jgi:hypothetical protein